MTSQFTRVADMSNRRRLRSASSNQLDVPSFYLPTVGRRDFLIAGAKVWNSLPDDVTSAPSLSTFRRHLKTYLFGCCYNTDWYCLYLLLTIVVLVVALLLRPLSKYHVMTIHLLVLGQVTDADPKCQHSCEHFSLSWSMCHKLSNL